MSTTSQTTHDTNLSLGAALLVDFKSEAANTRKVLEAVPDDQMGWKPHEKSMSLGQLASHIAETPMWIGSMMQDEFDMASAESSDYKPFIASTRDELMASFEKNARDFESALEGKSDAFLADTWTMRSGDKVLMAVPRHGVIRSIVIHHVIHHRGQLTVYLRLMGVAVPPTYGPTADVANPF